MHPKFQNTYICCLRDPKLQFCTEMGDSMKKQLHWACTARAAHNGEECHFALLARPPFFLFSDKESRWLSCFTKFDKSVFILLHYMVSVMAQNIEHRKGMVQVLPGAGCGVGPPLSLPVTLQIPIKNTNAFILLEPLRVIIVFNHFKGL